MLISTRNLKRLLATAMLLPLLGCPIETVNQLNATNFAQGRLPGSAGSVRVQNWLIESIRQVADGALSGSGNAAYKQPYPGGTNIIAVMPGTDLADEYVIMGAHYDHLGTDCPTDKPGDIVCNGATDNAAGVAALREIAETIAEEGFVHRRSLVLAMWDQEEQGLLGSKYYVDNPVFPLAKTVAYVNFDIMGAKLLPSLGNETFAIASESGGSFLSNATQNATAAASLDVRFLNAAFGDQLSDHTNFLARNIPSVFFTDAIGGCYHTSQDNLSVVSFNKLEQQILMANALVRNLLNSNSKPTFSQAAIDRSDAQALLSFAQAAQPDRSTFPPSVRSDYDSMVSSLQSLANKANSQYTDNDRAALGTIARNIRDSLRAHAPCENFDD